MAQYIKYSIVNHEPIRIANDETSQRGQTATMRYIPGSTIRGCIISKLAQSEGFGDKKLGLFSEKTQFLNAYPTFKDKVCIPAFKGFYEDKKIVEGEKDIQNVVYSGEFEDGYKRASLGDVVTVEGDVIQFGSITTGADLKIKMQEKDSESDKGGMFRNEYIMPGYTFIGYVRLADDSLKEDIIGLLRGTLKIGNARSAGYGNCSFTILSIDEDLPYKEYASDGDMEKECYLYLASDTTMRSETGDYCGLNLKVLEEKMGVKDLKILFASSSTRSVRGFNRNWGGAIPSLLMYEKGSVFHLKFNGTLTKEKAENLMDAGIGVRRNEGFGRILFLKGYETLKKKCPRKLLTEGVTMQEADAYEDDEKTLQVVAVNHLRNMIGIRTVDYIISNDITAVDIANSQLGIIDGICTQYWYDPKKAFKALNNLFTHAGEKESRQNIQKEIRSKKGLQTYVESITNTDIFETLKLPKKVMGFDANQLLSKAEPDSIKLKLISESIRFHNKREV